MQYVAQHTTIPISTVYATYSFQQALYIEMEYVKGTDVAVAWVKGHLSRGQNDTILAEIRHFIDLFPGLVPPE